MKTLPGAPLLLLFLDVTVSVAMSAEIICQDGFFFTKTGHKLSCIKSCATKSYDGCKQCCFIQPPTEGTFSTISTNSRGVPNWILIACIAISAVVLLVSAIFCFQRNVRARTLSDRQRPSPSLLPVQNELPNGPVVFA